MNDHYDALEIRDPDLRERALPAAVRDQVDHAKTNAPYFTTHFAEVDARAITDRTALGRLDAGRIDPWGDRVR